METSKTRKPFKKNLNEIPTEEAHSGSGKRQLILSKEDPISRQLHAMTKGFLAAGGCFDWHDHADTDEFFFVVKGSGKIEFEKDMTMEYEKEDLVYTPSNLKHKITADSETEFFFIRLSH